MRVNASWDQTNRRQRQSNIELLRIVAMLIIIGSHFSVHGGLKYSTSFLSVNRLWIQFLNMGGNIGVNVFILISGYFLINSSALRIEKVLKLWLQIFTYSFGFYLLFLLSGQEHFSFRGLFDNAFPITTSSQYWFACNYFVLYLLSPFLNRLALGLEQKTYKHLLLLLFTIWCVIPTFLIYSWRGNNLTWFTFLYLLAGYIRIYSAGENWKCSTDFWIVFVTVVITFLTVICLDAVAIRIPAVNGYTTYFYGKDRILILVISVFLLLGFLKLDVGSNRIINLLASTTFGVYLIHENRYFRDLLWNTVTRKASIGDKDWLLPYSLAVIILVFSACSLLEYFRFYGLENRYMKAVKRLSQKIEDAVDSKV